MVQPNFSTAQKAEDTIASPTAALDVFLDNQHQSYFEELYQSEAVCLCILRLLPPVSRHIVLYYVWAHQALRSGELKALLQLPDSLNLEVMVQDVLRPLIDRKILGAVKQHQNKMSWAMKDSFKRGLRNALTGMGTSNSFGEPYEPKEGEEVPGVDDLIEYGEETWESILKYMVSSGLSNGLVTLRPRQQVLQLLQSSGLMADNTDQTGRKPNLERLTITSRGFQFLLEDRQTQVWQILMYYVGLREAERHNTAPILSLFFSLGTFQLGQAYSSSQSFPSQPQQTVLADLEHYGFIYRRPKGPDGTRADAFYPTHLATSLCSGELAGQLGGAEGEEKRFLILETNYKIYAYTSNELEIAILNLFVDIRIRYPNLVVGKLDRRNVKAAMEKGISAAQIIAYLGSHAHAQMYNSPPPVLHPTIVDQLHLWDKERNRLKTEEASMFEFYSKELYDDTLAEVTRYDGLLLAVPSSKLLVVNPAIKDSIRDFIRQRKTEMLR